MSGYDAPTGYDAPDGYDVGFFAAIVEWIIKARRRGRR